MSSKYEQNRARTKENKDTVSRLNSDRTSLRNEYAPLQELSSILQSLEDEVVDSIQKVQDVGNSESARIEAEAGVANNEREQLSNDISNDIRTLNDGLGKLHKLDSYRFGKKATEKSVSEHSKYIDRNKELLADLNHESNSDNARTVHELQTLRSMLDLTEGDPDVHQMGGRYGDLVKNKLEGYQAHHIPPKSVSSENPNDLPAIYITNEDHAATDSYKGRMRKTPEDTIFNIDDKKDTDSYKDRLTAQINDGNYAEAFRNEVYEIKDKFGDKYDGAIKQAIDSQIDRLGSKI